MFPSLTSFCFFVIFPHFSFQQKPYNFRPESRTFEINDGEDTAYIGFDQIETQTIFGHCYIESETMSIDYPIVAAKHEINFKETSVSDGFVSYNNTGVCAFYYKGVDDKFPLKWTLTAYDNRGKRNYTEEVTVTFYYNLPLHLDKFTVLPTASIANFYHSDNIKWKQCTLSSNGTTVDLDLNSIQIYRKENIFDSRLSSLGDEKCGYKINNLVPGDSLDLTLIATDENNKVYRNTTKLLVRDGINLENRTLEVYLGGDATIICGKESDGSVNSDQQFCHLFNPKADLVSHEQMCYYHLDIVAMDDLGIWTCLVGHNGIMETLEFSTELVEKISEYIVTFTEDNNNYYIIGCKLNSFARNQIDYCKFTRPDGKLFKVADGGATTYYNTLTADLNNGRCSLEIMKPLRDEDKGSWKCEAVISNKISGGFVTVESNTTIAYNKKTQKNVQLKGSFIIDCMVPYSSDYCHIIAPNGTQFKPDDTLQITSGLCLFTVKEATASDNGTWQCSIAQSNGIPDERIVVEISVIQLKVLYANVEATENDEIDLICNTNGIPIEYCRFVAPNGLSYSLRKENSITKKISYKGRGLEYGDCGITISSVEAKDNGQWSCHISSGRYDYKNKAEITKKIELSVNYGINSPNNSPTLAQALGISLGVIAVVIATGGFIFYRYCGRRCRGNTEAIRGTIAQDPGRVSNDSSSGESIILSVSQNTYNT